MNVDIDIDIDLYIYIYMYIRTYIDRYTHACPLRPGRARQPKGVFRYIYIYTYTYRYEYGYRYRYRFISIYLYIYIDTYVDTLTRARYGLVVLGNLKVRFDIYT